MNARRGSVLVLLLVLSARAGLAQVKSVVSPSEVQLALPFSPGILTGEFLFLSGAVASVAGSSNIEGTIQEQTRQTLENLGVVLRAAGMDFQEVVSASIYLADARHHAAMNDAYRDYFPDNPPASAAVEAAMVLNGSLIEISMIAVRKEVPREFVYPQGWPRPGAASSWGVLVDESTLFVSGLVGVDVETGQFPGDFRLQAERAFGNLRKILEAVEMDLRDVVSVRVFLGDSRDFGAMNAVFRDRFPENPPVRATMQARLPSPDLKIEIQCIAVKGVDRTVLGERNDSPFSPAIKAGDWIFTSGMVGRGPQGFAPGDLEGQARQTFENLQSVLALAGAGFEDIVDVSVFLSDVRFFDRMNQVYRQVMPRAAAPTRATVATPLMSPDALIEIMMIGRLPAK